MHTDGGNGRFSNNELSNDEFSVQVQRSARRTRTVSARLVGDVLTVMIPARLSRTEEAHWVQTMTLRFQRKMSAERINLRERVISLARQHDLPRPKQIDWADNMQSRWGSCTPSTASIRISTRLARFPDWVLNYVIVHELCHLRVSAHSAEFWQLVQRYPRSERAIGFLMAKSLDDVD